MKFFRPVAIFWMIYVYIYVYIRVSRNCVIEVLALALLQTPERETNAGKASPLGDFIALAGGRMEVLDSAAPGLDRGEARGCAPGHRPRC
jgi:hypothetical protein